MYPNLFSYLLQKLWGEQAKSGHSFRKKKCLKKIGVIKKNVEDFYLFFITKPETQIWWVDSILLFAPNFERNYYLSNPDQPNPYFKPWKFLDCDLNKKKRTYVNPASLSTRQVAMSCLLILCASVEFSLLRIQVVLYNVSTMQLPGKYKLDNKYKI